MQSCDPSQLLRRISGSKKRRSSQQLQAEGLSLRSTKYFKNEENINVIRDVSINSAEPEQKMSSGNHGNAHNGWFSNSFQNHRKYPGNLHNVDCNSCVQIVKGCQHKLEGKKCPETGDGHGEEKSSNHGDICKETITVARKSPKERSRLSVPLKLKSSTISVATDKVIDRVKDSEPVFSDDSIFDTSDTFIDDIDLQNLNNNQTTNLDINPKHTLKSSLAMKTFGKNSADNNSKSHNHYSYHVYREGSHRNKIQNTVHESDSELFEESFQDVDLISHIESLEGESQHICENRKVKKSKQTENQKDHHLQVDSKSRQTENVPPSKYSSTLSLIEHDPSSSTLGVEIPKSKLPVISVCDAVCDNSRLNSHPESIQNGLPSKPETNLRSPSVSITTQNVNSDLCVSTAKTPAGAASLKDRLKKKLLDNVGAKSPHSPGVAMEMIRESMIHKAKSDAEKIQREGTEVDIGPFYGLPSKVQQLLQTQRGITSLYDWQDECLKLPAVRNGQNLIYSLPTSGGKTLVAEILILREILCKKKDAMMILPFVSIVQEKVRNMSQLALELDFLVEEYAGSKGKFPPIKHRRKQSLYVATIEKAHSLVNSLLEQGRLNSMGLIVVDELHMIGEGRSRGSTMESTLLKVIQGESSTQIIGMSATLNNLQDLQKFLHAETYSSDFRPVQLTEYVKVEDNIFEVKKTHCPEEKLVHDRVVTFEYTSDMSRTDPDHLLGLVLEVIPEKSCLVFCPTKKNCENVALMLSKLMANHKRELSMTRKQERKSLLKELYSDGDQRICPVLQHTIHFGIAYHHSGLTMDERKLIEEAYTDGILCLLTCTSTLAAGVNLPAKRVILRSPYIATEFLSRSQYKQMIGRAGRAGIDTSGESILLSKPKDRYKILDLISGPLENCYSSLSFDEGKGVRSLLLSTIGLQVTKTTKDVFDMMTRTLLSIQSKHLSCDIVTMTRDSLQQLLDMGLVVQTRTLSQEKDQDESLRHLDVTPLGKATFKGSVDIDFARQLYQDLKKAEESLVLASYLHLLYLVTPYDLIANVRPPWMTYFKQLSTLTTVELKVAELIGVSESYIARKASGQNTRKIVDESVIKRFYLTLMLYELWKQKSIWEVAERFDQPRGFIQNLLSGAASFASCVYHFCQELEEFWAYQDLLGNFVKRLSYCVSAELIPLMEIPGVKLGRAKQLYNMGLKTLQMVANAEPEILVKKIKQIPRKIAKQIVASAKILLNERAESLLEEAEELVTVPSDVINGLQNINMPDIFSQDIDFSSPNNDNS